MPINLKDFFKKIEPGTSSMTSPKKSQPASQTASDASEFQPERTFKRATKSLVKSKASASLSTAAKEQVVDLTGSTPVKPPVSPKRASPRKASPIRTVAHVSPKKASPVRLAASPKKATPKKAAPAKKKVIAEDDEDDGDDVPAPSQDTESPAPAKKNFKYQAHSFSHYPYHASYREYLQRKNNVPAALGSKEIPVGAPNCLEGLAFLFTGDLSSITRDTATDLVKRYAWRVVSAPSKKTNFVVVGENPGPSKMEKIKALGLEQLSEDDFLEMIRKSNPSGAAMDEVPVEPAPVSPEKVMSPKKAVLPKTDDSNKAGTEQAAKVAEAQSDLWTVKYAPQRHQDLIGNPGIYEKLTNWLSNWRADQGEHRAALLSGPPGIGKTTMANLVCQELGFDRIEMNASDTRNKKTLHETVRDVIDSTSLSNMFKGKHGKNEPAVSKKHVLIMDECDGMSAGDRGGMAELILLIKKTKIPIICVCNDRASPKVRSLANYCLDLRLRRPDARQIVPRIKAIAEKEGLTIHPNALEELAASTHADIRQILNLLSTFKLTKGNLSYDASKGLSLASAKDIEQGPFDATQTLLGGQYARMSLNERVDQYFIDNSLVPLMVHENYLKCRASSAREIQSTRNSKPNYMDLCAAAADSLSLSDKVDSLIRGSNQEWSLAPLHGVMSSVLPAYYVHGNMGGRIDFASWLGNYSKTSKNQRLLTEITKHSFMHTLAGKVELRLDYIPVMAKSIVKPMSTLGAEGVDQVIQFLDDYSLSREDVDSVLELCLDPTCDDGAFGKIPTAVRSGFTRKYNQGVHRLPYMIGGPGAAAVKRISSDIATGQDDEDEDALLTATPDDKEDEEEDLSKDKNIKLKPAKKAAAAKTTIAPKRQKK